MLCKKIFFLMLIFCKLSPMDIRQMQPLWLIQQAEMLGKTQNYPVALEYLEVAYFNSQQQKQMYLQAEAARRIVPYYLQGLAGNKNYQKALKYADEAYNLAKSLVSTSPDIERAKSARTIYAYAASYLGRIYKEALGVTQDYKKALGYFIDSYNASQHIPSLQAANAYDLAEIYDKIPALDNDHTKSIEFLNESIALGNKYLPQIVEQAQEYLTNLQLKEPVNITFAEKTSRKFDLQSRDFLSNVSFAELLRDAKAHNAELIIARVKILNENNEIGSFYCDTKALISWLWSPTALNVFLKINEEEALMLNHKRRPKLDDGRNIVGVDFFEWNPEQSSFEYYSNDKEMFEGYAGRRKRLFLVAQNYSDVTSQAFAEMLLSEMIFLGLGGPKNLTEALKYVESSLDKKKLPAEAAKSANIGLAQIWLDLALDYLPINPNEAMKYFQRASLQTYNPTAQICGLMYLSLKYAGEKKTQHALFTIDKILALKYLPDPIKAFYTKEKQKLEKLEVSQKQVQPIKEQIETTAGLKQEGKQTPRAQIRPPTVSYEAVIQKLQEVAQEPAAKKESATNLQEELTLSDEQKDAFDTIKYQINAQKVISLLKKFDKSLEDYQKNKRNSSSLRDAKETLEKIAVLPINDADLQASILTARQQLNTELQKISTQVETTAASTPIKPKIILDPFDERSNLPYEFQKTLDQNLQNLSINPLAPGAEKVQSLSKYNIMRIHIGKDYRLFYIVTDNMIGIVGIAKRGKSTYNKLDEKYNNHIKWFTEVASLSLDAIFKAIEQERKKGHKEKEIALIKIYLYMAHPEDVNYRNLQDRLQALSN